MPDDSLSPADKAVLAFFEITAFALGWSGVDRLLAGAPLIIVMPIFIATILTSYTGFKWPEIRIKLGPRFTHYLSLRPIWMVAFIVLSLFLLRNPTVLDFVMNLHQRWQGWLGYAVFGLVGAGLLCGYWWLTGVMLKPVQQTKTHPADSSTGQNEKKPTLLDLFTKDFPGTMKAADDAIGIQWNDGEVLHIKRQLYLDFPAKTKFVGFYVPRSDPLSSAHSFEACLRLADSNAVQGALDDIPGKVAVSGGYRNEMNSIQDLTFSGRVLIYHDDFLSITQKAQIIHAYTAKHCDVQFRGPDYLGDQVIAWHHQQDTNGAH